MKAVSRKQPMELGKYIVADPAICHGKPTFKGTRIMVFQVLEQVAHRTPWEKIVRSWRGKVPMAAITEAIQLGSAHFKEDSVHLNAGSGRKRIGERDLAAA
jgi:uncharacterized protein (DUF433 family)